MNIKAKVTKTTIPTVAPTRYCEICLGRTPPQQIPVPLTRMANLKLTLAVMQTGEQKTIYYRSHNVDICDAHSDDDIIKYVVSLPTERIVAD